MKCSACYEENATWQDVCSHCGRPTVPLRFCPNGHLLPPKVTECPVCPMMWPDPGSFSGPPILRGVLWVDGGRLRREHDPAAQPVLELRDGAAPLALRVEGTDSLVQLAGEPGRASVQFLVRPDGVRACLGAEFRRPGAVAQFQPIAEETGLRVGPVLVRVVLFEVPEWVPAALPG